MQPAIGYLRVSTREQGRSGLGLAAQRFEIERFGSREGFSIESWYQDVQTGAGADALLLRPGLATALKEARAARCPLIVSRLDRLSRNVHFISGLMEHRVHFMVAALGRDCDHFVLHIYASLAEQERKLISDRNRAAAAAQKRKGRKFGLALQSKAYLRRFQLLSAAALRKAAKERAEAYRVHIEWALSQPGLSGRPISFGAAARRLNGRHLESPKGGRWSGATMASLACRLGFRDRRERIPLQALKARVHEILKQHPDITVRRMLESVRPEYPLRESRGSALLRSCRQTVFGHNRMQKQIGWRVDHRSAARLRIAAVWKRHPEFTARQVAKQVRDELKPRHTLHVLWVKEILRDCRRGFASHRPHRPKQLGVGRRAYGNRRERGTAT